MIYKIANRIVRRVNSYDKVGSIEKQIEDTARNILEQIDELEEIGRSAGLSDVSQRQLLQDAILKARGIQADVEFLLNMGDRINPEKVTVKIKDSFVKVHGALSLAISKFKKYEMYAHTIRERNEFKTVNAPFTSLLNRSRNMVRTLRVKV